MANVSAEEKRVVANNFAAMTVATIGVKLVQYIGSAYAARVLGPVIMGQIYWNANLIMILSIMTTPGTGIIGQRDVARNHDRTAALTSLIASFQLLLAVVVYALICVFALSGYGDTAASSLLIAQAAVLLLGAINLEWVLRAHERMVFPALLSLMGELVQMALTILLVVDASDAIIYVFLPLPILLVRVVLHVLYLRRRSILLLKDLTFSLAGSVALLRDAWPVAASIAAVLVYYYSAAIILGVEWGNEAVGVYGAAYSLMLTLTAPAASLYSAYFPRLAKLKGDNPDLALSTSGALLVAQTWIGAAVAGCAWVFGDALFLGIYGSGFPGGEDYFRLLAVNVLLVYVNWGYAAPLTAWGYQRQHLIVTALSALLNVAIGLLLIPAWGIGAAIAATIAAEFLVTALTAAVRARYSLGAGLLLPSLYVICIVGVAAVVLRMAM